VDDHPFSVADSERDGAHIVHVAGEVDLFTAPALREHLLSVIDSGAERIVVDLSGVGFLDSSGLGVLVGALKRLAETGQGRLLLAAAQQPVDRIFEITGIARVFTVLPTVDEALRA
jgi:anti-sigma B factor antagonist